MPEMMKQELCSKLGQGESACYQRIISNIPTHVMNKEIILGARVLPPTKELFQVIPIHMMDREIILGMKNSVRQCPL